MNINKIGYINKSGYNKYNFKDNISNFINK